MLVTGWGVLTTIVVRLTVGVAVALVTQLVFCAVTVLKANPHLIACGLIYTGTGLAGLAINAAFDKAIDAVQRRAIIADVILFTGGDTKWVRWCLAI